MHLAVTTRLPRAPQTQTAEPEITAALRTSLGDVTLAARALGVDARWIRHMLRTYPELWPGGAAPALPLPPPPPEPATRRTPRPVRAATPAPLPPGISGDAVTETLRRLLGSIIDTAHALGIEGAQMRWIIAAHPELWPDDVPRRGSSWTRGRRALVLPEALRAVLVEHEGGIIETARILDLAPSAVVSRLKAEPWIVPEGMVLRRARGGRPLAREQR